MSSTTLSTTADLPSTSYVLNNIDSSLRPTEAVACMTCPLAVWMLKDKAVECYCRTLYMVVWETHRPGKIRMCDAPEQARLAAEATAEPTPGPAAQTSSFQGQDGDTFGLMALGAPKKPASAADYL